MKVVEIDSVPEVRATRSDLIGEVRTQSLIGRALTGTEALSLDRIHLHRGLDHQLHRHPNADQVMIIESGRVLAYGADKEEREIGPGNVAIFEAGEWHGLRALEDSSALNMFCGVGGPQEAGYEERQ